MDKAEILIADDEPVNLTALTRVLKILQSASLQVR